MAAPEADSPADPLQALPARALRRRCDPQGLPYGRSDELGPEALPPPEEVPGQERALEALRFGTAIPRRGFNVYVLGEPGTGRHELVQALLRARAREGRVPGDWCYLHNFDDPHRPWAVELPAGRGRRLREDMERLVEDLRHGLRAVFQSEPFRNRLQEIEEALKGREEQALEAVRQEARRRGLELLRTPGGFAFAPAREGKVLDAEAFQALPEEERRRIQEAVEELQGRLRAVLLELPLWHQEARRQVEALRREAAEAAARPLVEALRRRYAGLERVQRYLERVLEDVVGHVELFLEEGPKAPGAPGEAPPLSPLRRYQVNLLVERDPEGGAPVVVEDNPSLPNLLGRIEHLPLLGALVTDFTLIKAGALHRANGGYLLLDAHKVLGQPFAWEGLKRALRAAQVRPETPLRELSPVSTVSLEPEPVPLDLKVVLVGDRLLYYLLWELDPEFEDLFKVQADFEDEVDWSPRAQEAYARLLAALAFRKGLRPLEREAAALLIEEAARLAGDAGKLSGRLRELTDLLMEADHRAGEGARSLAREHVEAALAARERRAGRLRERMLEAIRRGQVLIDTQGAVSGQINGLSVIELGPQAFGVPHRITARVRLGEGELIDIEREVELGGPLHSKGVLILSGFLGARYAADLPLSLAATLVFEQSYGQVEGDSASLAELCALLSALAEVPLRQDLAVTGSVNQRGQVQAIGGVNEKIEGFFAVCRDRGLTGTQGVIIPRANVQHLMLRPEVVAAAEAGRFHVHAVDSVDQALTLLSGLEAGEPDEQGRFPEGSFNGRVRARLEELARLRRAYSEHRDGHGDGDGEE
ncbi:MAG: ATP-dependent protease, partial [Gammaproteobacteria bacterium]